MSVRTDTVNLIVNVNGNQAQNNLNELRKKASDIKFEMSGLKKGTQEYIDKGKELKQVTAEMDNLKKQIGITALSQKELTAELNKLKALKGSVAPFSAEFKDLDKQIKAVESRLYDVRNGVQGFASFFSKISDEIKQFGVVALGYLGFEFLSNQFQNIIRGSGKLSDQLADLQRVAGLTKGEAKELNKELSNIDTRTSTGGLREIAIIAGKLGVAKKDILEFTKSVDQLVVSLGDELGGATEITDKLGKILNVFDGKIDGDNISKLGNAFVELANTGAASGGFIADFDQRLAGIAKSANIGLGELSGLGAGLEELGGRVESSSTAIQKLIISISSDIPKAAKIAGVDVKEFNDLFANNATEALLKYSEGLVKNKSSFAEVTASLADAGEEGARTVETISKLGQSADILRGRIDLGKKSILENTSITEAYRLKNENLGAQIDKLGKSFNALVTSKFITGFVEGLITSLNSLLSVFTKSNSALDEFKSQAASFNNLEKNMLPLLDRIEELGNKSNRSKIEQVELNKAIQTIGNTIPIAVTEFDKYGKAIGISTTKAREFIDLQRLILKEKNRNAISEQVETKADIEKEIIGYKSQLDRILKSKDKELLVQRDLTSQGITPSNNSIKLLNVYGQGISSLSDKIGGLQARLQGVTGIINELNGESLKVPEISKPDATTSTNTLSLETEDQRKARAKKIKDDAAEAERLRKQREKEYENLKRDADKFYEEILALRRKAEAKGLDPQQAEVFTIGEKYSNLLERANKYYTDLKKLGKANKEQLSKEEILLEESYQAEILAIGKKFADLKKSVEEKRLDDNYKAALATNRSTIEDSRLFYKKQYAEGYINKAEYEAAILKLGKDAKTSEFSLAEKWASKSKQAAKDVVTFKTQQEIEGVDQAIAAMEALTDADIKNKADAKARADQELQETLGRITEIIGYVQKVGEIFSSINSTITNNENKQLALDKKANDDKKNNYKKQLDNRLISKEQYDRKVEAADVEYDNKSKDLKRKQAQREKDINLFQAIINTASAVVEALPNLPLSLLAGILGGFQIAAIASQPLPEFGDGDWIRTGDKHSDASGGITAKIERDEAVMKAKAMNNNEVVTVTGTTAQITSALNSRDGGTSWASGALIMPMWTRQMPATINPNLPRIMEQGGIVRPMADKVTNNGAQLSNELLSQLVQEQKNNTAEIKNMKTQLHAVISLKDLNQAQDLLNAAKAASGY